MTAHNFVSYGGPFIVCVARMWRKDGRVKALLAPMARKAMDLSIKRDISASVANALLKRRGETLTAK
jgi:Arc/MetJ family transcription regulator